ncbi:flagellar assembly peptidoglycan hydrolase FlgJ [Alteromonas sp. AMM-1]|uniref:flagellar assembly peptidoglycan hydrolase FlgJ n=1 Tax=Alteromonas sp. AMM-1 TaxID=3394233 RepID=UPI0039A61448
MDLLNSKTTLESARNVHDMSSINRLKEAVYSDDKDALKEAAQQFEAIFVQMMLKSMRKAQDAMADEDSPFNSEQMKFYRDMHDQQMAADMASGGGMGLAKLIVQQLGQPEKGQYMPSSVLRNDGNLASLNWHNRSQVADAQALAESVSEESVQQAFKTAAFDNPAAFVQALYPVASQAAEKIGVTPEALIAQAAVETGWGQYVIHDGKGNSTNNLFGIKANSQWKGNAATVATVEFDDTVARQQTAAFPSYESLEQGLTDYVDFIRNQQRYQGAVEQAADPKAYFNALQQAGYATDPQYADKIMSVLNSEQFKGYLP